MPMMMTRIQSSPTQQRELQQNARRVSFEDTDQPNSKRRFVGLTGGSQRSRGISSSPSIKRATTIDPSLASIPIYATAGNRSNLSDPPHSNTRKNNQVTVLHGRVMKVQHQNGLPNEAIGATAKSKHRRSLSRSMANTNVERTNPRHRLHSSLGGASIRDILERKAAYGKLLEETKHFHIQVATLEHELREYQHFTPTSTLDTPNDNIAETGWRVRLLLTRAQDTDVTLWKKLYEYEKTLSDVYGNQSDSIEMRELQTSCMKLHRDFKQCHKALLMCLSLLGENDTHQLIDDTLDHNHTANTSPIVEAVGWTGMTKTLDESSERSNTDTNGQSDQVVPLSRSVSPIPSRAKLRQEKEIGREQRKSKPKRIIDDDEYDESYDDDNDYNLFPDKVFDAVTNFCSISGRCDGTNTPRNNHDDSNNTNDNYDEDEAPLSWICGDLLDYDYTKSKKMNDTNSGTKNQIINRHVDENDLNKKRSTTLDDTDEVVYNNNNDNDNNINKESTSFTSSKYKWFQHIQDHMHSMKLDLLRFRSRSVSSNRNTTMEYDDTIDHVREYPCRGATKKRRDQSNRRKNRRRHSTRDDMSSTSNSSDAPMDES